MYRIATCVLAAILGVQPMRVTVNIPAYRLDAFVSDTLTRTMPIAVGMPRYPTPRGSFAITSIDWNPRWVPPDRPWAAREKPMPPGPLNPMGKVKLNFQPLYFLHGTPAERSIGSAASHGCVRLAQADAIALGLEVQRFGSIPPSAVAFDPLTDSTTTHTIRLVEPVPLEIRYDLVEIRSERVAVYRDIYRLATRSMRAEVFAVLADRGIDTTRIERERVSALVRRIPASGRSAPIDSLLRPLP
jgi:murein L,D-transpeptidase YcbB/YkuD